MYSGRRAENEMKGENLEEILFLDSLRLEGMIFLLGFLINFSFLVLGCFGCFGGISTPQSLSARNRALAAKNVDGDFRIAKCEGTEVGTYKAKENYFLLVGGEDFGHNVSAALETRVLCQTETAYLKFDYWANNENPIVKVCVIPEADSIPQCEQSHLDVNPLTFEIPASLKPFRLRIQIDSIGPNEIILLDSLRYEGQFCEIISDSAETNAITETTTIPLPVLGNEDSPRKKKGNGTTANLIHSEDRERSRMSICEALSCDFNHGDSCFYSLSGFGGTAEWRIGEKFLGNPHTGIHRPNPIDLKMTGFAFVGLDGNDFSEEVFVMESPKFSTKDPLYLVFDLYQRSKGPQLKVCINSFDNCPYSNPPLSTLEFWRPDQRILLDESAQQIYFMAGTVGRNLYLAVDNIRLQTVEFEDYCSNAVR